jgi:hypothetical protein
MPKSDQADCVAKMQHNHIVAQAIVAMACVGRDIIKMWPLPVE